MADRTNDLSPRFGARNFLALDPELRRTNSRPVALLSEDAAVPRAPGRAAPESGDRSRERLGTLAGGFPLRRTIPLGMGLSADAARKRRCREEPEYRAVERQRDAAAHAAARQEPEYRAAERQRDAAAHAAARQEPEYRAAEQQRNTAAHAAARQEPEGQRIYIFMRHTRGFDPRTSVENCHTPTHARTHTHPHTHTCTRPYATCPPAHTRPRPPTHAPTRARAHTHTRTRPRAHTPTHTRAHTYVRIRTYIYAHCTHTHTRRRTHAPTHPFTRLSRGTTTPLAGDQPAASDIWHIEMAQRKRAGLITPRSQDRNLVSIS
jgi:hypothetical protein